MRIFGEVPLLLVAIFGLTDSIQQSCSRPDCSSDGKEGVPPSPCQLQAISADETSAALDCKTDRGLLTTSPKIPDVGQNGRLSLELRRMDSTSPGGVLRDNEAAEGSVWSTRLDTVARLPLQLDDLTPFTRYQVRLVAWSPTNQLLNIGDPGTFATSERRAAPSTEPQLPTATWASGSGGSTLRVAWQPPVVSNARLAGYTLRLEQWWRLEEKPPDSPPDVTHSEFVRQGPVMLDAPSCPAEVVDGCRLRISLAAVNSYGTGPAARLDVVQQPTAPTTSRLLLQVGGPVKLVALPGPPRYTTVVHGNDTAGIVAFAVDAQQQLLFAVDHLGALSRRSLANSAVFELPRVKQKVLKLAVDWVAQQVYMVTKPGDILLATDWYGDAPLDEPRKIGESPSSARDRLRTGQIQLQLDPINGYLFLLLDTYLYRSELPRGAKWLNWTRLPLDAQAGDSTPSNFTAFRVLPSSQRLLLISSANWSSVTSCDLGGRSCSLKSSVEDVSASRPIVRLVRLPDGRLAWTDGSAVAHDRMRLHQRSNSIRELECAEPACQPKPTPLDPPSLELFCGFAGAFARIRLPEPRGEQSDSAFRRWRTAVWSSDLPTKLHQPVLPSASSSGIDAPQFVNLPLPAVTAAVSAVAFFDEPPSLPPAASANSPWSPLVACTRQRQNIALKLFTMTNTNFGYRLERLEFNETSMAEPRIGIGCQETSWHGHYPAYMSAMGSNRAWIGSEAGDLLRVDVANPDGCQWRGSQALSVGAQHIEFEWLSGSLLWIGEDASIYRSNPDGSLRLLHRTAATHFTLLTSRALLLWSTTGQVWAGSLGGGAKRLLLELTQAQRPVSSAFISAVHVEDSEARAALEMAFAGAAQFESRHRIFYAVFSGDNSAALFAAELTVLAAFGEANCSASEAKFVATLRPFSRYSQVQVLGNKVLWNHPGGISVKSLGEADRFFNDSFLLVRRSVLLPFAVVRDNESDLLDELARRNLSVIPTPVNASLLTERFNVEADGELLVEWPESTPRGLTRYLVSHEIDGRNRSVRVLDRSWLRLTQIPPLAAVRLEITPLTAWAQSSQTLNVTFVAPIAAPKPPVNLTVYRHPKPSNAVGATEAQLCWSPPDLANSRAYPVQEYRVTLRVTSSSVGSDFGQRWSKHRIGRQRTCFGATLDSADQVACFSVAACNSRGCTSSGDSTEQNLIACSDGGRFDRTDSLRVSTDKPTDSSGTRRDLVYEDVSRAATPVRQQDVTAFAVKRHHARIFYAIGRQLYISAADQPTRESIYSGAMSNDTVIIYWMGFDWLRDNLLWLETATSLRSVQRTRLMLIEFGRLPQATVVMETVGQPSDIELLVVDRQLRFRRATGNYQSLDLDHLIPSDSLSRFAVAAYTQRDFNKCRESLGQHPENWALCHTDAELNASLLLLRGSWDLCEVSSVGGICACLPVTGLARLHLIKYNLVLCEVSEVASADRSLVRILSVQPESTTAPGAAAAAQKLQQRQDSFESERSQFQRQQREAAAYSLTSIFVERSNGQLQRSSRSMTDPSARVVNLKRVCYNSTSLVASLTGVTIGLITAEVLRPSQSRFAMNLRDIKSNERIAPNTVAMFSTGEDIQLKLNFSDKLLPGRVYEPILSQTGLTTDSDEYLVGCRFRSAATPPDPPRQVRFDENLGLVWEPARPNGSPVLGYELSLVAANASDGSVVYWKRLPNVTRFSGDSAVLSWAAAVRVAAVNSMGLSAPSQPVPIPLAARAVQYSESGLSFVTLTLLGALLLLLLGSVPLLAYFLCKRSPKPSTVQIPLAPVLSQEYVDLGLVSDEDEIRRLQDALRRQQPTQDAAAVAATAGSLLAVMTRVSKRQVNVVRFLGSGAFGQVFEGFVRLQSSTPRKNRSQGASAMAEDPEDIDELPCAVKMVKKTASAQEKADFLREAALASRFDHRHIVRCLGVCVDSDPHFILLELMEGGDLLGFLRRSRGCSTDPCAKLSLANVVKIILDVANGCCYLESQKFVHRDIAARNCLVTQRSGELLVKIGDFGLARDVYRSEYYKKDVGRAMLPVRWMSPEALTDGVFSTQSDVWAFGVLCWEALTLGQQPYSGKSNGEVLRYVRRGGILEQPANAPEPLYHMMLTCWKHDPSHRPSFAEILHCVEGFHVQSRDSNSPFAGPINNRCSAVSGLRSRHASSVYHNQHSSTAGLTAQTSLTSLGSLEGAVGGCAGSPIQYTTLMLREGVQHQQLATVRSPALGRVNISADFGSPRSRPPLPPSQLVQQQQQQHSAPVQRLNYIAPLVGSDEESDADDAQPNQPLTPVGRVRVPDGHSSSSTVDKDESDADSVQADDEDESLRRPFLPAVARLPEANAPVDASPGGSGGARRPLMGLAAFQTRPMTQSPPDFC